MEGQAKFLFHLLRQPVLVVVVQFYVEGLQPAERGKPDAAGGDRADIHAFEVV